MNKANVARNDFNYTEHNWTLPKIHEMRSINILSGVVNGRRWRLGKF